MQNGRTLSFLMQLQIRKIVLQYISQPSCVILAITAANTDIANSDRLVMLLMCNISFGCTLFASTGFLR